MHSVRLPGNSWLLVMFFGDQTLDAKFQLHEVQCPNPYPVEGSAVYKLIHLTATDNFIYNNELILTHFEFF